MIIYTKNEEETLRLGCTMGKHIVPPFLLALVGELGSGKTVLTRGIARGMGITVRVKSPSFVLIHEYPARYPLYHFDLYRLNNPRDLFELGYQEYFYHPQGVVVIEWADKIMDFLPSTYLLTEMQVEKSTVRKIVLTPKGNARSQDIIRRLAGESQC